MERLSGKTAIITGSTRGMGCAMALRFAAEGAAVVVTGRDEAAGVAVVRQIEEAGGKALFREADVGIPEENSALVESALQAYGSVDIVVANAGMLALGSLTEISLEEWQRAMDVNLNSVFYLMREAIPHMQKQGGVILVTGSIAADKGFPRHTAYCTAKGAVRSLVTQVAVEYAPKIRVNLLEPGPVDTALYRASAVAFPNADTILNEVPDSVPMRRTGLPEDVASAALFLVSDESSWITGSVFRVDGGVSAKG